MSIRRGVGALAKTLHQRYPSIPYTSLRLTTATLGTNSSAQSNSASAFPWIFLSAPSVLFLGMNSTPVLAEDVSVGLKSEDEISGETTGGLRKIEDGSVVSNIHTSKWRVFTDTGRDRFLQGKTDDAERLFQAAIQEAKEGFGERDPHVASACNNLAELYRVQKVYDKAEPLYLEAVKILEESLGLDDIRVGAALHNLGQFYLVQRKLDEACVSYEIKRRVLGEAHTDYADTMYHLGTVFHLLGKGKDSEALIQDSIRILEDNGQGESVICIRRLRYLAQIYIKSSRPEAAENIQRKILQKMELTKGWNSLETVFAAEGLALTLQSVGSSREAQELFERCLDTRKMLLSEDHIQIAGNLLHIVRVVMLNTSQLKKTCSTEAITELNKAKDLLRESIRIARHVLDKLKGEKKKKSKGISRETVKDGHAALMILLQSYNTLGTLEITKMGIPGHKNEYALVLYAEEAFDQCISAFKEYGTWRELSNSSEAKAEYLSCLKHLCYLLTDHEKDTRQTTRTTLQELKNEIKKVEGGCFCENVSLSRSIGGESSLSPQDKLKTLTDRMYRSFLKRIPTIRTSVAGDRSLPHPVWPIVAQKAHNRPPTFPNKHTFTITPKPKVWKKVGNCGSTNGGPKLTIEEPTVQAKQKDE
ncbi:Kinesin light chain 3 [Heracleum sosnowskyi]|uniref:Kinesin light chain 3 n=1 Tax=Heracleum sosnowskyi TaxID=360622 RepID=A0AAD8IF22_9APIA|nr:Kinesin light chain 3 [Heracleum sosnowskyi]